MPKRTSRSYWMVRCQSGKNARRELFSQLVAQGKVLGEAYVLAGFKPNTGNPSTLNSKKEVQRRVAEILSARNRKVLEKTAHEVETTREKVLGELEEARQIAKRARNGSAMAMCSLGKAKVLGLIIDRRENGDVGAFDGEDRRRAEWKRARRSAAEALGDYSPETRPLNCRTSNRKCNSGPEEPCKSLLACCFALLL